MMRPPPLEAYTDGACSRNPGPGGWAWAVPDGPYAAGPAAQTTNQRMEIQAALEAVRALGDPNRPLEIVSDSTYVVRCFTDGWWRGWLRKGWVNSQKKPVANRDLWEPLIGLVRELDNVTFRWVKGHSGDTMNDLVDQLAVEATQMQHAVSGSLGGALRIPDVDATTRLTTVPAAAVASDLAPQLDFGAADAGDDGPGRVVSDLTGHALLVTGLRPDALGPVADGIEVEAFRSAIGALLEELATGHDDVVVVSGLRLGSELAGAEAALERGLPLAVVLPFPEPHAAWAAHEQQRFDSALRRADAVLTLEPVEPHGRAQVMALLAHRDAYFVRRADAAVVVADGEDPRTERLLDDLRDRLGDDGVTVLHPDAVFSDRP